MKFKRLLTVGFMALFCAGTAMAVSRLNSVQVTPASTTATVSLRTTGSYVHKEYRPDDHLMLVDLTGMTADAAVERTRELNSAALKGYKVSVYTSASGSEVTRVELALGDNVTSEVSDESDGLKIVLTSGGAGASAATSATGPANATVESSPKSASNAGGAVPGYAKPIAKASAVQQTTPVMSATSVADAPQERAAEPTSSLTPTTIRSISVQRGQGTLDVVIDGPSSASPFLLKNPDRLVLDFRNAVVKASIKNISVHTADVVQVRVGRYQAQPPVTRIVIDLSGPRTFDVVPSAKQVIVRIQSDDSSVAARAHSSSFVASAKAPAATELAKSEMERSGAHAVMAGDTPAVVEKPEVEQKIVSPVTTVVSQPQVADPKVRADMAADTLAVTPQAHTNQPKVETSRAEVPLQDPNPVKSLATPVPAKYTGEPISVNLKDVDLKDFFRLIHEISGLNIVLDPNVKGTVTLVLDDVPWDQALDIVLKNNALDRELQGNVLRIAATDTLRKEAVDRRAQSEAVALAVDRQTITRFLSYAKATEVVPTIKKFLTARGDVISDNRTNALIISDIPSVLPNLDRLISQLDKKSPEVEIEVRVVSATRSFSRDLGVQLGLSWGNGVSAIGGLSSLTQTTTTSSGGSGTTTTNSNPGTVPLFSSQPATGPTSGIMLSNITKSYGIDAILTAAENHNLAKVLSRPRIVTQSNVKAEVKQGLKIPVYTASTQNANASVSYIDAVLRLSVTPQITSDNTIFLNVDVENTQPQGTLNSNDILSTQQVTTQVLVTDGGTVVIGGVIQTTNSVSTSQTPVLGSIPWLGNLFKERAVKTETDELIFFITPKIIQT